MKKNRAYKPTTLEDSLFKRLVDVNWLEEVTFEQHEQFIFPYPKKYLKQDKCFVVDILALHNGIPCLVIEIDGTDHLENYEEDRERDYLLLFWFGIPTVRFSNRDVKNKALLQDKVIDLIRRMYGMKE